MDSCSVIHRNVQAPNFGDCHPLPAASRNRSPRMGLPSTSRRISDQLMKASKATTPSFSSDASNNFSTTSGFVDNGDGADLMCFDMAFSADWLCHSAMTTGPKSPSYALSRSVSNYEPVTYKCIEYGIPSAIA